MIEYVILVDENDAPIGRAEKMEAHEKGLLHRAFSVFVSNSKGEILLQRRALTKYHSAGLWTNTCCSHPRPSEDIMEGAHRRLQEEMGFDCELREVFKFTYTAKLEAGLTENEIDHVLVGIYEKDPVINPEEVEEFKWAPIDWLIEDLKKNPDVYTAWFKICFKEVLAHINI
ncbi:MAG: isopentenyl-diphosphate Delta-isomerase [Candidatus Pacebacteria bacterium]|nr:isopentenyl-diphosphate Delta-isomerase [Candidatus Paceibacterota bacterium]